MTRVGRLPSALLLMGLATGCSLDFSGLTGGPLGAGGAGSTTSSTGSAGVCAGRCADGGCTPLARPTDPQLPVFRVAAGPDTVAFADPEMGELGLATADGVERVVPPVSPQAVATQGDWLYFATPSQGVFRCRLPGCDDVALLAPAGPETFARQLVADGERVFWITGPDLSDGAVYRCAVAACVPELVADGQLRPHGLALDETHVYWTVHGSGGAADGAIRRAPKDGGAAVDVLTEVVAPSGIAVTADDIVFTEGAQSGGAVYRVPKAGGDPVSITDGPSLVDAPIRGPASLVVVGDRVVFTNDGDSTVMACPLAGCSQAEGGLPTIVARDLTAPRSLTAAGGCLAWGALEGIFAAPLP